MTGLRWRSHPLATRVRAFDRAVDRAVSRRRSRALDAVVYPLSSAADHSLLWVAIGAVREATGRGPRGSAARLAALLAAESALTNGPVKLAFRRLRPESEAPPGRLPFGLRHPKTSAFPSGHATSGFTAAAYLAKGDPLGPAYYGLAGLVAFSRIYVRLHHASDVLAGIALGLVFGRIARRLAPDRPEHPPKRNQPGMDQPGMEPAVWVVEPLQTPPPWREP